MNGRLGKDQIGNLTCRNTSVVDYCTFSVEDSFGITSGSASSQWECSFLSVKVNGVWTSEKRVAKFYNFQIGKRRSTERESKLY
jgi:hypothetical protein